MRQAHNFHSAFAARQNGFSLTELLVAMALGLVLIGGVIQVFFSNRQIYETTENLSRMQENARVAFELMARDIREAGLAGCGNTGRTVNTLNNASTTWWTNWQSGIVGYEGTAAYPGQETGTDPAERVHGTDAVQVMYGKSYGLSVVSHDPNKTSNSAQIFLNKLHTLKDSDIVVICDYEQASILQISNANQSNVNIVHNTGGSVQPGNATKGLGFPLPDPITTNGTPYTYGPNSTVMKFESVGWYIGNNGRPETGGRSLYRRIKNDSAQEVVEGISDLQISYLEGNNISYVNAGAVSDWDDVLAVRLSLTLNSLAAVGTDGDRIQRQFSHVISLRNRLQ